MSLGDNKSDIITVVIDNAGGYSEPFIDAEQLKDLARIHCSVAEMADIIGCSTEVLKRGYSCVINAARAEGRAALRRRQYEMAMVNPQLNIWLGKQILGQRDQVGVGNPDGSAFAPVATKAMTLEEAEQLYLAVKDGHTPEPAPPEKPLNS
jgi:hypothetical protein